MSEHPQVLIVDDYPDTGLLLRMAFASEGIASEVATNGGDALNYLENGGSGVKVILLDLAMPVLDGLTVAEEIRRNERINKKHPSHIAFYTAQQIDKAIERAAKRYQVEKIYQKGTDFDAIIEDVRRWIAD